VLGGKKVKVNGIAGGIGFVLSCIVGIISGGSFLMVLLRAVIFGALFFVFIEVSQRLIGTFLPELLNPDADAASAAGEAPGSRIDISVEDDVDQENTDLFEVSGTLDQERKKDYTQQKGEGVDPAGFVPSAPWAKDLAQGMDGAVGRDPLFSIHEAIPENIPEAASSKAQHTSRVPSRGENLDPKKMASAIQTILKQE
jgi:hypothetical protein